jgi:hypothetical protein
VGVVTAREFLTALLVMLAFANLAHLDLGRWTIGFALLTLAAGNEVWRSGTANRNNERGPR